jgi:hypothetical protein
MNAQIHRTFIAALWLTLAGLAACGPGIGGTGTGAMPDPASFGATPASVCAAPFAGSLKCPVGAGVPGTSAALTGTELVRFADVAAGGNASAVIDANQLQFQARCQALQFTGVWGVLGTGEGRFFGTYSNAANTDAPASMRVASSAAGELQMTMFNGSDLVLLGPLALQGVDAPVLNPAACP